MNQQTVRPPKKHRMKKRFLILNLVALALVIFSVRYIDRVGDRYEMHTSCYGYTRELVDNVKVECEREGIVSIDEIAVTDQEEVVVRMSSLSEGKTRVTITFPADDAEAYVKKTAVRVSMIGTIIEEKDYYINFNGFQLVAILFVAYLGLVLTVMIYSFCDCYRRSDYSYPMIAYGGLGLFLTVLLMITVYKMINNVVNSFSDLTVLVMDTGRWFLILLAPMMMALAAALSVSNVWLLRHEGFRPVNALGIALSAVWFFALALTLNIGIIGVRVDDSAEAIHVIRYIMTFVVTYFECMLLSTAACAFIASRHKPPLDRDYIIILGCAIRADGSLTPILKGRVDAAIGFDRLQYEKTGRHACFVPSGGQGSDEVISEGEAMERYLLAQGVEPEHILREDKSVNTFQNMAFSKAVIEERSDDIGSEKIAFATTNYHVFRGYILSRKNGFTAQGISAKTKWYFFPNAFIREFIGLLADRLWHNLFIIVSMTLILLGIFYLIR